MAAPASLEEIDPDWLTSVLVRSGEVASGQAVTVHTVRIGVDRGFTGEVGLARWETGKGSSQTRSGQAGRRGEVIVKLPDAVANYERCAREIRFYETLAPRLGRLVPRALHLEADPEARRVALVLERVVGRDGDAATPSSDVDLEVVVREMASVHARWWRSGELAASPWLPRWGQGTAGRSDPHERRVSRYRRRVAPFLHHHVPDRQRADVAALLDGVAETLASRLARIAALPPTLIHADLHPDNLVFVDDGGVVILDWQSVSYGPATYDVARFVAGDVDAPRPFDVVHEYLTAHAELLVAAGVPTGDVAVSRRTTADMALTLLAGFVSGYGGRAPDTMMERERRFVARTLSPRGLLGIARAALDIAP